jgi:hypothetical protein
MEQVHDFLIRSSKMQLQNYRHRLRFLQDGTMVPSDGVEKGISTEPWALASGAVWQIVAESKPVDIAIGSGFISRVPVPCR